MSPISRGPLSINIESNVALRAVRQAVFISVIDVDGWKCWIWVKAGMQRLAVTVTDFNTAGASVSDVLQDDTVGAGMSRGSTMVRFVQAKIVVLNTLQRFR
jgi:hypothetical protein